MSTTDTPTLDELASASPRSPDGGDGPRSPRPQDPGPEGGEGEPAGDEDDDEEEEPETARIPPARLEGASADPAIDRRTTMEEDTKTRLVNALKKLDTVMITTTADNGTLRARPMAVADVGPNGEMWFVTSKDSEKAHEILHDARALVSAQDKRLYVSVSGTLEVLDDPARVHALWRETWRAWFPMGKDDPSIVLIRLHPEIGEYWDQSGTKGLQYLFEAARAILDGKRVDDRDPKHHAKVPM